jgi:hypothetical protein
MLDDRHWKARSVGTATLAASGMLAPAMTCERAHGSPRARHSRQKHLAYLRTLLDRVYE